MNFNQIWCRGSYHQYNNSNK